MNSYYRKFRLGIKESPFVENHHKVFTTKMHVNAQKIGTVEILTDTWLLFTFQKKRFFSFFVISKMVSVLAAQEKVSNGVAFH